MGNMIESLFNPKTVKKSGITRFEIFFAGVIFTLVGALFAINVVPVGPNSRGIGFLVVAFICIPAAPFFVQLFKIEEEQEAEQCDRGLFTKNLFTRHLDVIEIFTFFFLAVVFATSLFYVAAPENLSNSVFQDQLNDLKAKGILSGEVTSRVAGMSSDISFWEVFENNSIVLLLSFVFSFILGAGAVFLISWNASVIGALIGRIASSPSLFGYAETGNIFQNYLIALPITLLRLLPHGIFEFGAYFIASVAGGVLSAGIIQESIRSRYTQWKHIKPIVIDSIVYLGIAVVFLAIGALVEASV